MQEDGMSPTDSYKEGKLFTVLSRSPARPFQILVNNNNFSTPSRGAHTHTHTHFPLHPSSFKAAGTRLNLKCPQESRRWFILPVWSRTGSCLDVRARRSGWSQVRQAAHCGLRDVQTHFHTHPHPPRSKPTHPNTPLWCIKLTLPPCCFTDQWPNPGFKSLT